VAPRGSSPFPSLPLGTDCVQARSRRPPLGSPPPVGREQGTGGTTGGGRGEGPQEEVAAGGHGEEVALGPEWGRRLNG